MNAEQIENLVKEWAESAGYSIAGTFNVKSHIMISIVGNKDCKKRYEDFLASHNLEHTAICMDAFGFGTYIKIG